MHRKFNDDIFARFLVIMKNVVIVTRVITRDSEVIMFSPGVFVITRDSEVIMFSPCVFVCLFVCLCVSMFVTMFVRTI